MLRKTSYVGAIKSLVLLATLTSLPVVAQDSASKMDVVVVTASRMESTIPELSQSVDIISRDEIEARNPSSVTELLRQVAGLNVIQQGSRGNVTSILMRGGEPNFTVVLIDGVKVNDPTNTRGGSYDFSYLDPNNIERIEIVRGPMSALYGSDSLAGVVSIITRSGEGGSSVQAEAGGHGLLSGNVVVGGKTDRMDGYLRLHALTEDGDIEGASYEDSGIDGAFHAKFDEHTKWGVSARYLDADSTGFPEDSGGPENAVLRDVDVRAVQETHLHAYLDRSFGSATNGSLALGFYQRDEAASSPGIAPGVFDGVPPNSADTEFSRDSVEVNFEHAFSNATSVVLGSEWQREDGRSVGLIDFGFPVPTDFALKRDTLSFYGEASVRRDSTLFQASLRWDEPDDIKAETSAQVGIVHDLGEGRTQLRANFAQGFKAPSFFALAHPLVGNPDLISETAESLDIGIRHELSTGTVELTLFHNDYENLIDFDPQLFTNVNRSEVSTQGAELSGSLRLTSNLVMSGHVTVLDTEIKDDDSRLRGRPDWRFGAVIDWTINDKLKLVASLLALDDFWEVSIPTGGVFLDGYQRVDLALTYRFSEKLRLVTAVDNALDEEYEEAVGFPAAGARIRVSAEYQF